MALPKTTFLVDFMLGPLPVDSINRTLGHDLSPGDVIFTVAAQRHVLRNHPEDYPRCLPHVRNVVQHPHYLGDDLKNPGKIEMVSRVPALGTGLLVALVIEPDAHGRYGVSSCYPISEKKIENRRQKGFLIISKTKN